MSKQGVRGAVAVLSVTVGLAIGTPALAQATPDMCAGHMDQTDASKGFHPGEKSVPGCEGASGPDYANNAVTPDASPHPDARQPQTPMVNDSGSYEMNIHDSDGIQADEVRKSTIHVPGRVS
jgi:hypothetical protein